MAAARAVNAGMQRAGFRRPGANHSSQVSSAGQPHGHLPIDPEPKPACAARSAAMTSSLFGPREDEPQIARPFGQTARGAGPARP